ncbi:methyltransferase [Streptomyces noursei]|uniref:methyltransferase n=1 Tax=Streptomyces noursei TaxID=1971 RepID=UPI0038260BE5
MTGPTRLPVHPAIRHIQHILRTVRDAMTPGTRLLVVDAVLPVDGTPHPAISLGIVMPAVLKGRERTAAGAFDPVTSGRRGVVGGCSHPGFK